MSEVDILDLLHNIIWYICDAARAGGRRLAAADGEVYLEGGGTGGKGGVPSDKLYKVM